MKRTINIPKEITEAIKGLQTIDREIKTERVEMVTETFEIAKQDKDGNLIIKDDGSAELEEKTVQQEKTVFDTKIEKYTMATVTLSLTVKNGEVIEGWAAVVDHGIKGAEGSMRVELDV